MAVMQFRDVADLKRNPVERQAKTIRPGTRSITSGFPPMMAKQMQEGPRAYRPLRFPNPDKPPKL